MNSRGISNIAYKLSVLCFKVECIRDIVLMRQKNKKKTLEAKELKNNMHKCNELALQRAQLNGDIREILI